MIRALVTICGLSALVLVMVEVAGVVWLWSTGRLTAASWQTITMALSSSTHPSTPPTSPASPDERPAWPQIEQARLERTLHLDARELELTALKRITTELLNQLISERQVFDERKAAFEQELHTLLAARKAEATEQTRTILMAMPAEEAVTRLMGLPLDDAVELVRGLPEKHIARLLQAFQNQPETAARGQELFEALYRGHPERTRIDNMLPEQREAAQPQESSRG
ncbi:MAG: hypothetical protein KatS3mg114_0387 [Planctomycetaceae bacterium]|nr:MAG: hypothetical protein KatS3mg114_0387 [Planctomycetaceae bacterium]